jgi:hypothetical protein
LPKGNSESFRALNTFKVPKKAWSSWTLVAKHVFNKTYESMMKNPEFFMHTEVRMANISDKIWKVTAWNAAWTAASICSRGERSILLDLTNRVKGK